MYQELSQSTVCFHPPSIPSTSTPNLHQIDVKPLNTLATELQRMIFGHLQDDPVTSVCLGLTCKAFYGVIKEFYPRKVSLNTTVRFGDGGAFQASLKSMLWTWIGPNMYWDYMHSKCVTKETIKAVVKTFDDGMVRAQEKYGEAIERDWERIENRKRDRRRYGYYIDEDQWSSFSAMESVGMSVYEPTEGTCDGDSQHSRRFWLKTLRELEFGIDMQDTWGDGSGLNDESGENRSFNGQNLGDDDSDRTSREENSDEKSESQI